MNKTNFDPQIQQMKGEIKMLSEWIFGENKIFTIYKIYCSIFLKIFKFCKKIDLIFYFLMHSAHLSQTSE